MRSGEVMFHNRDHQRDAASRFNNIWVRHQSPPCTCLSRRFLWGVLYLEPVILISFHQGIINSPKGFEPKCHTCVLAKWRVVYVFNLWICFGQTEQTKVSRPPIGRLIIAMIAFLYLLSFGLVWGGGTIKRVREVREEGNPHT